VRDTRTVLIIDVIFGTDSLWISTCAVDIVCDFGGDAPA